MTEITLTDRMPEALVTLYLAFWLLDQDESSSHIDVAIDGAHVQIKEKTVFEIEKFLLENGCGALDLKNKWRGKYSRKNCSFSIKSARGFDIQSERNGETIKVECKGGPLKPIKGKSESLILATAIGQAITSDSIKPTDQLWVAVPDTEAFAKAGERINRNQTFLNTGIQIALVHPKGSVRFAHELTGTSNTAFKGLPSS